MPDTWGLNVQSHNQRGTFMSQIYYQASDGSFKPWVDVNGAAVVSGLSRNQIVQGAGTYNATEVLGYEVLVQGSSNWAQTPVDGTAQTIPFASRVVGNIHPVHLSAITVGTGGSALLYIPS